jgi:hypothetical protein
MSKMPSDVSPALITKGRDRYKVGHENLIAAAGRSFGAKPVSTSSINTSKHHHN